MLILVVEDDRLLNHTLCYNLNAAGYAVDSALTKQEAKDFLTKHGVLTINYPEMTAALSGELLALTPLEYRLLKVLTKNPHIVLTRQVLLEKLNMTNLIS